MDFVQVRESFRQLLSSSPPHVAKVESWMMASEWLKAPESVRELVARELQQDLSSREAAKDE